MRRVLKILKSRAIQWGGSDLVNYIIMLFGCRYQYTQLV